MTHSGRFRSHEGRQPDDGPAVVQMDEKCERFNALRQQARI
jgi:hypothetical protein